MWREWCCKLITLVIWHDMCQHAAYRQCGLMGGRAAWICAIILLLKEVQVGSKQAPKTSDLFFFERICLRTVLPQESWELSFWRCFNIPMKSCASENKNCWLMNKFRETTTPTKAATYTQKKRILSAMSFISNTNIETIQQLGKLEKSSSNV